MPHYYTDNANLCSNRQQFDYYFDNEKFIFTTDNGVFSKKSVDYGSYVLIRTVYKNSLGNRVLDLGCGWGPVGIILKRFHPEIEVTSVDVNSRAVDLTKENAKLNGVELNACVSEDIESLNQTFDSVILNPPIRAGKKVIYELYQKSHCVLSDRGSLTIVIQKKQGALSSFKELENLFKEVKVLEKDGGYHVIQAIK